MQFKRLFTQGASDPYGLIHFREPEAMGDAVDVPLQHPDNWSHASVEILADDAACDIVPAHKKPIEENTVPSWLWRQSRARAVGSREKSVRDIFDRVAGSAAYQGWKQNLFADEDEAMIFFDEARYMLAQRFVGFEPKYLAALGLSWAYGVEGRAAAGKKQSSENIDISNAMIDAVVSGRRDPALTNGWQKIIAARTKTAPLNLRFSDTEAQWEMPAASAVGVRLNLMAFRHNDGSVNIEALRQAVRIAVLLIDLNSDDAAFAIGYSNLAPLLMALALPYDSEAGRATAAAISAIITAEAFTVSAELASLRGASADFIANRDMLLRAMRNHRRAAYGEHNDYEKISVIPSPLALASCPDLALTAAARGAWDRALELAQNQGLRHTQVTGLFTSPSLTLFMESESDGIAPMRSLAMADGEESRALHPSVGEALMRLGYDGEKLLAFARHVAGAGTLENAPVIDHAALRSHGLTNEAIERIEAYLPQARTIRHAVTPAIAGFDFCREILKIPAAKLDDLRFNLLAHLGFSDTDIRAADIYCYGQDGIAGAGLLTPQHAIVFATAPSLPAEAQVKMAAALQRFVSGEAALGLHLPLNMAEERFEKLLLDAWRRGVKSLTIQFDAAAQTKSMPPALQRKTARMGFLHTKAPQLPKRQSKAAARHPGMASGKPKNRGTSKTH